MDVKFCPGVLSGEMAAMPSKSDAHRIFIAAALSKGATEISLSTLSEDMEATIGCLSALGAEITQKGELITVSSITNVPANPCLDAFESGSTLRFLIPLAGVLGQKVTFCGRGRLPERPQGPLLEALTAHGMDFTHTKLPFTASGKLSGGEFTLRGDISSQFVTGLLFALPLTKEGGRIKLIPPVESKSYTDMTVRTLRAFGITVTEEENAYVVPGGQEYVSPGRVKVEGDWSNAAFWLCAGALGQKVSVSNLSSDSAQGDRAVAEILRRFGANVTEEGDTVTVSPGKLRGTEIDASDIPDLSLPLAMVAAQAEGVTVFRNMGRLRMKESDRLAALEDMINGLCGENRAKVEGDTLYVTGGEVQGGKFSARGDHRLVMSAAILALNSKEGIIVSGAEAVRKSYPHFIKDYQSLGGNAHEFHNGQPA